MDALPGVQTLLYSLSKKKTLFIQLPFFWRVCNKASKKQGLVARLFYKYASFFVFCFFFSFCFKMFHHYWTQSFFTVTLLVTTKWHPLLYVKEWTGFMEGHFGLNFCNPSLIIFFINNFLYLLTATICLNKFVLSFKTKGRKRNKMI